MDEAREQIADFLDALIWVYTLIVIAWMIFSFVFSMGLRVPYSRPLNAVLDFLRDVTEPYLRIFRRLPLRVGPLDLTPIVAILALRIVGGIVVSLIDPGRDRGGEGGAGGGSSPWPPTRPSRRSCADDRARRARST